MKILDYTIMIAVVCWLKCIIIVQKVTSVVEFWALLSSHWSPLLIHHCEITYVAMHVRATTMMQPNAIACVNERMAKLFSVWKLQDTACDRSLQESCKLLIAYSQLLLIQRILWANETALFWKNCECIHLSILKFNIINLAIDLPSEEASIFSPECILWATVYLESYCAIIGMSHCTGRLWKRLEYERKLVDANRACPGIHKVSVGPATRSAVATWKKNKKYTLVTFWFGTFTISFSTARSLVILWVAVYRWKVHIMQQCVIPCHSVILAVNTWHIVYNVSDWHDYIVHNMTSFLTQHCYENDDLTHSQCSTYT